LIALHAAPGIAQLMSRKFIPCSAQIFFSTHIAIPHEISGIKPRASGYPQQLRYEIEQCKRRPAMKSIRFNRNIQLATLFATTMMFAVAANAESAKPHRGTLNIKTETVVQGVTLTPGEYEVREMKTADGAAVEFVRKYWNEAASELVQAEEDQFVARVPVAEQRIDERPAHTKLQLSADKRTATALEFRHVPIDYIFAGTESASRQGNSADSANGMQ
jgi:hypothetical protein